MVAIISMAVSIYLDPFCRAIGTGGSAGSGLEIGKIWQFLDPLISIKGRMIMNYLIYMMTLFSSMPSQVIFDFNKNSVIQDWVILDDVVMGGVSSGTFKLNEDGFGVFEGSISLDNNGGFSSVRYRFEKTRIQGYTKISIKLRGDGKKYQFRIKTNSGDYYSYIAPFLTSGEWQEIEISLKDMYPSFRGRRLNQSNFSADNMEEITFLIGNKKEEKFKLLIDKIELK